MATDEQAALELARRGLERYGADADVPEYASGRAMGYGAQHFPAVARALLAAHERLAEVERRNVDDWQEWMRMMLGVSDPCDACGGIGRRTYPCTSVWRGGAGGQTLTSGICDKCWGTGDLRNIGVNLREALAQQQRAEQAEAALAAARQAHEDETVAVMRVLEEAIPGLDIAPDGGSCSLPDAVRAYMAAAQERVRALEAGLVKVLTVAVEMTKLAESLLPEVSAYRALDEQKGGEE